MDLNHFDYDIHFISEAENMVADRLSRQADHNTSHAALLITEITDVGHVTEDHVQEDHVQGSHVTEHMTQVGVVKWMEEVRLTYRTDPFMAVTSDLISAGATDSAAVRALPASV
jgi:hypothetical protein